MTTDPLIALQVAKLATASALVAAGSITALVAPGRVCRWLAEPRTYQPHTEWLASQEDR
jgi:hypothetical protein